MLLNIHQGLYIGCYFKPAFMKFLVTIILFIFSFSCSCFSQGWVKNFKSNYISDFVQTPDGGYAIILDDQKIVKTNSRGDIIDSINFNKNYTYGKLNKIYNTKDNGILIRGSNNGTYIIKLVNMKFIWSFKYIGAYQNPIIENSKGTILINSSDLYPSLKSIVICINKDGDTLWTKKSSQIDKTSVLEKNYFLLSSKNLYTKIMDNGDTIWSKKLGSIDAAHEINTKNQIVLYNQDSILIYDSNGIIIQKSKNKHPNYRLFRLTNDQIIIGKYEYKSATNFHVKAISYLGDSIWDYISVTDNNQGMEDIIVGSNSFYIYLYNSSFIKLDIKGNLLYIRKIRFEDSFKTAAPNNLIYSINEYTNPRATYLYNLDSLGSVYTNHISGKLFQDLNKNCKYDSGEKPLIGWKVQDGEGDQFAFTDSFGNYTLEVDTGVHPISTMPLNYLWKQECPATSYSINIKNQNTDTLGFDFTFTALPCSLLKVDLSSPNLRRCFLSTHQISYANEGTVNAQNVKIEVNFPSSVIPLTSTKTYTKSGNLYTFELGTLEPGQAGSFTITDSISCDAPLGSAACIKAKILPDTNCLPISPVWDKSSLTVSGQCFSNLTASFSINNIGLDMSDSTSYRLYSDNVLIRTEKFKLKKTWNMIIQWPGNGKSLRLEADQRPGHPGNSKPRAFVEACGTQGSNSVSYGYVASAVQDDEDENVEISCGEIRGSFDPNDKIVSPGNGAAISYIKNDQELEYIINFQNTGNDTAFIVRVIDTLSTHLNFNTFTAGAMSHKASYKVYGLENPIVEWTFKNILLPDSTTNKEKSQGFAKFKINLKSNLPEGTEIKNRAGIIFDYNAPVMTNYTHNVIRTEDLVLGLSSPVLFQEDIDVNVWPNPFTDLVHFEVLSGQDLDYELIISNLLGRKLRTLNFQKSIDFKRSDLDAGLFIYQIYSAKGIVATGKLRAE